MHPRSLYACMIVTSLLLNIDVLCQDISCLSPKSLLEGRRRIVSAVLRASNDVSSNPASEARLSDEGWCSGQLATNIFDPYIEVDFGMDLILTSVTTDGTNTVDPIIITGFIERYRVEVAGIDGNFQFITSLANSSQPVPAIFPLGQSRISNHTSRESLPRPVIGQILRINPYEWSDDDHVCTKLEVFGCPLKECQSESRLHNNPGVDSVTVSGSSIDYNNLFNFDDTGSYYCGPTNMRPFTMTITYSSPVLLTEIGIHGRDRIFPLSNQFVTSFSLSFSEDGGNFTEYIRDTGSTEFTVSDERHYFGLWPPITASSIKITINRWNDQPCMSLLMLGCNHSDVVDHSINVTNGTAAGTNSGLLDDMIVTLTTTEFMTTTTELVIVTATVILQTATENFTVIVTDCTPSPSPTQSSGAVGSTSSDTDNTPIYVAVAIVMVGLLITITANIVGVILCRHYCQEKRSSNKGPSFVKCNSENNTEPSLVDTKNAGVELDEKLKLESVPTSVSASADKNQTRLETINTHYESVNDPQRTITDQDINTQSSSITSKNEPAIVDNPAYSTSSGPPLIDNPAYIAVN